MDRFMRRLIDSRVNPIFELDTRKENPAVGEHTKHELLYPSIPLLCLCDQEAQMCIRETIIYMYIYTDKKG